MKKNKQTQKYHRDIRSISSSPTTGLPEWEDKNEQPIFKDIIQISPKFVEIILNFHIQEAQQLPRKIRVKTNKQK